MRRSSSSVAVMILLLASLKLAFGQTEDVSGLVRKAVEQSTLDQAGTPPFHLKAVYAPSFDRDKESHRTGEVESPRPDCDCDTGLRLAVYVAERSGYGCRSRGQNDVHASAVRSHVQG